MTNSIAVHDKETALHHITDLAHHYDITLDEIGACLTKRALTDKSGKWLSPLLGLSWCGLYIWRIIFICCHDLG